MDSSSLRTDMITCDICLEFFDNESNSRRPMILPCGHSVCEACMKKIFNQQGFKCPLDKKLHFFASLDQIPINYKLASSVKLVIQSIQKNAVRGADNEKKKCEKHSKELVLFYCKTDNEEICSKCLIKGHKEHDVTDYENHLCFNHMLSFLEDLKRKCLEKEEQFESAEIFFHKFVEWTEKEWLSVLDKVKSQILSSLLADKLKYKKKINEATLLLTELNEKQENIFYEEDVEARFSEIIIENKVSHYNTIRHEERCFPTFLIRDLKAFLMDDMQSFLKRMEKQASKIITELTPEDALKKLKLYELQVVHSELVDFNNKLKKNKSRIAGIISKSWYDNWKDTLSKLQNEALNLELLRFKTLNEDIIEESISNLVTAQDEDSESPLFWDDDIILRKNLKSGQDFLAVGLPAAEFFHLTYGGKIPLRKIFSSKGEKLIDLDLFNMQFVVVSDNVIKAVVNNSYGPIEKFRVKLDFDSCITSFKDRIIDCLRNKNNTNLQYFFDKFSIRRESISWTTLNIWKISSKLNLENFLRREKSPNLSYDVEWTEVYIPTIKFSRKVKESLTEKCILLLDIRDETKGFHFKKILSQEVPLEHLRFVD